MVIDKTKVSRVLVITLSNLGDCILTTPVVKTLALNFPEARIDVMAGPNGKEVFEKDPSISKVIVYDKHASVMEKRRLSSKLRHLKYDLVVDLRNTIFGLLLGPRYRTSPIQMVPKEATHRVDAHLWKLKSIGIEPLYHNTYICIPEEDQVCAAKLLEAEGAGKDFIVVAPGARSRPKRWPEEAFAQLCDRVISEERIAVVFVGQGDESDVAVKISGMMKSRPFNLVNKTSFRELAAVVKKARLVVTNDSAPLHLACAMGTKTIALFGPTDPAKYGPTGIYDVVIRKEIACAPCEAAVCRANYECMRTITADEVFRAVSALLHT